MTATAPTHADPTRTEAAAAKRVGRYAATLEARVLAAVVQAGEAGLTAQEAREALGFPIERHYSVAPRLSALKKKGLVEPTDIVRDHFAAYTATPAGRAQVEPQNYRCRCSHRAADHGRDRKDRPGCWGAPSCGCVEFRERAE